MKILALLPLLVLCCTSALAVTVPERLVYDISWSGVKAGTAVQEVTEQGNNLRIVSTARSAPWIKMFFPVDDEVESVVKKGSTPHTLGMPLLWRERINEGRTHRHKEARFDEKEMRVVLKDFIGKAERVDSVTNRTYDTLSSIYFLRKCDLVVGKPLFIEIYDGKKLWETEVRVLRKERLTTSLGSFNTIVVRPVMKFQGLFARTGDVHIWVTDDAQRVPVKMVSKVKIGSITATLVGGSHWPAQR